MYMLFGDTNSISNKPATKSPYKYTNYHIMHNDTKE